jgi:YebC/PmpR family DNA-binding regulatory protein
MNFALRIAVDRAKAANMPKENIERAIKRGTGELEGVTIEELTYEAVGPANSQFVLKILTDNKNRTAAEVRHLLSLHGGAMGAVLWNFDLKGVIRVASAEVKNLSSDEGQLELIDAGADDVKVEDEGLTILSSSANLQKIKAYLESKNIIVESAAVEYVAKDAIFVSGDDGEKIDRLISALEDNQDISEYFSNVK